MNATPKLVASRSLERADDWQNSTVLRGDLVTEAGRRKQEQDIVVMCSASVIRTLMAHDLVDEYQILVFPAGTGRGHLPVPQGRRARGPDPGIGRNQGRCCLCRRSPPRAPNR